MGPVVVDGGGRVLAGVATGRTTADEVTVFKSTGHAVEDVAAAAVTLNRADLLGIGTKINVSG